MLTTFVVPTELSVVIHLLLVEVHDGNGTVLKQLTRQRHHARSNHQRIGRLAHLRIADLCLKAQRVTIHGDVDDKRVALHTGIDLTVLHGRFRADAVMLNHVTDITTAFRPIGKSLHALQRIGQFTDDG